MNLNEITNDSSRINLAEVDVRSIKKRRYITILLTCDKNVTSSPILLRIPHVAEADCRMLNNTDPFERIVFFPLCTSLGWGWCPFISNWSNDFLPKDHRHNQMQLRRRINGVIDDGDIWRRRDKYLPIENSWVNHWRMLCGDCSMCINFAIMNSYLFRPKFFACSRKIHRKRQEFPLQVGARNPVHLVLFDASVETPKL